MINTSDEIKLQGVLQNGYGLAPKMVMLDTDLSIEAKAIYCYISSFCGNGTTAFPSVENIIYHLGITEKRFYKYRKELVDKGYIKIHQRRNGNRRTSNLYEINMMVEPSQFESVQNESVQIEPIQNDCSNNNSLNNNKFNNNNKHIYAEFVTMTKEEYSKLIEQYGEVYIKEKIIDLNLWKGSKGKNTKSDYLTLLTWIRKDNAAIKPKGIQTVKSSFDFGGM